VPTYYVRDNGIGFDIADCERIFRVFERLHSNAEFAGSGLGLATVEKIVHRHGGRVWAKGLPGEGATFRFTLAGPSRGGWACHGLADTWPPSGSVHTLVVVDQRMAQPTT
jgi:light-regulated signal transduction histidine kinase (bacteriophytochrome)